jgi:hypothetical protein
MATEQPKPKTAHEAQNASNAPASDAAKKGWRRLMAKRRFVAAVVALLAVVAIAGVIYSRPRPQPQVQAVAPPTEIALGKFQFAGGRGQDCCVAQADFALAITVLSQVDDTARETLAARRLRVQQGVEQLLRNTHSADFDDPSLVELKRQMREQIDQTLGMRAIGEIIITDLKVRHNPQAAPTAAVTTDAGI